MIIGLTGLYCAGKNYIASLLEKRGFPALDVDVLGHEAIRREREVIAARFGSGILRNGEIDRRLLGEKVFGKPEALAALEAIVHPAANVLTEAWIAAQKGETCIINAALLHKSSVFNRLDAIIIVKAPLVTRLIRAGKRDHLSLPGIMRRFGSQKDFSSQYFQKNADKKRVGVYIINNTAKNPEKQLDRLVPFFKE
jgi:dephospho-CoA kinase